MFIQRYTNNGKRSLFIALPFETAPTNYPETKRATTAKVLPQTKTSYYPTKSRGNNLVFRGVIPCLLTRYKQQSDRGIPREMPRV